MRTRCEKFFNEMFLNGLDDASFSYLNLYLDGKGDGIFQKSDFRNNETRPNYEEFSFIASPTITAIQASYGILDARAPMPSIATDFLFQTTADTHQLNECFISAHLVTEELNPGQMLRVLFHVNRTDMDRRPNYILDKKEYLKMNAQRTFCVFAHAVRNNQTLTSYCEINMPKTSTCVAQVTLSHKWWSYPNYKLRGSTNSDSSNKINKSDDTSDSNVNLNFKFDKPSAKPSIAFLSRNTDNHKHRQTSTTNSQYKHKLNVFYSMKEGSCPHDRKFPGSPTPKFALGYVHLISDMSPYIGVLEDQHVVINYPTLPQSPGSVFRLPFTLQPDSNLLAFDVLLVGFLLAFEAFGLRCSMLLFTLSILSFMYYFC
ncbi:hypothetical protein HELRODRAFT_163697 [Helobdella robusta]|uniref:Uncharacterized protein n=1 Tax=Helobdella robusta TaxID=6412 RepID=T1EUD1_HELRO|nr:hypothetical protein HELRODRAFT_163697 [Helobdella robusta]ESN96610.1 hypothetical protein HELRODRAFT_163697 [Helobdella robusta]